MALVGLNKAVCKSRSGHLQLYQYCVLVILECGYNIKQWNEFQLLCDLERFSKIQSHIIIVLLMTFTHAHKNMHVYGYHMYIATYVRMYVYDVLDLRK